MKKILLASLLTLSTVSISHAYGAGAPQARPSNYTYTPHHNATSNYSGLSAGHSTPTPTRPPQTFTSHSYPTKPKRCWRVYFWDRYGFYRSTIKCAGQTRNDNTIPSSLR